MSSVIDLALSNSSLNINLSVIGPSIPSDHRTVICKIRNGSASELDTSHFDYKLTDCIQKHY